MSIDEKMNRLREKLLDAALVAPAEEARLFAKALGMMPSDPILKVGVAEPKASDADAMEKCVKVAKEALASEGWVVLDADLSAGETLNRVKKEGLDLFMGQGLPSFWETMAILKGTQFSARRDLAQAIDVVNKASLEDLRAYVSTYISRAATFAAHEGVTVGVANQTTVARWLIWHGHAVDFDKWMRGRGRVERTQEVFVGDDAVAVFRWTEPFGLSHVPPRLPRSITAESLRGFACSRDGLAFKMATGKSPESARPSEIVDWINHANLYLDFVEWEGLGRKKADAPAEPEPKPNSWFVPDFVSSGMVGIFGGTVIRVTDASIGGGVIYRTVQSDTFNGRTPIALVTNSPKAVAGAATFDAPPPGVSHKGHVYATLEEAQAACVSPECWFVADAPMKLTPGEHAVVRNDVYEAPLHVDAGAVGSFGREGRGPIALRARVAVPRSTGGKWTLYDTPPVAGRVFSSRASAEQHIKSTTPAITSQASHWFVPAVDFTAAEYGAVTRSGGTVIFDLIASDRKHGRSPIPLRESFCGGAPDTLGTWRLDCAGSSVHGRVFKTLEAARAHFDERAYSATPTHWFVPATAFEASEAGHRVTQNGSNVAFYSLASDRAADRSPIPLRLDPSQAGHGSLLGVWRIYKPGVSVAGVVCPTLEEAKAHVAASTPHAPKKARYGMLDINVGGPSTLTIVETVDGVPVSSTVRTLSPGPVLGTMLHVAAMCFKLGVVDLYGDGFREPGINNALVTIATFMRGEALHGISEADRSSFLRMATTIEWPRAYTIPTFKALPAVL